MKPVRFDTEKHLEEVNSWCDGWGMGRFPDGFLPTVGFIVPGVAVAWLYATDSDVAYMENVLSNKEATDEQRGEALDCITEAISSTAREIGSKWLLGASNIQPVLDRAVNKHGFRTAGKPVLQIFKVL